MAHELWKLERGFQRDLKAAFDDLEFRSPVGRGPRVTLKLALGPRAPSLRVTTIPAKGKPRTKTLAPKKFDPRFFEIVVWNLVDRAVHELLRKGLVGFGASKRAPDLMLWTDVGPPMGEAFAVDEARSVAWLGDWGWLRRVDLETGAVQSTPLGDYPAVREVVATADAVWVLADHEVSKPRGGFREPAGRRIGFGVLRYDGSKLEKRFAVSVGRKQFDTIALSLSVAEDGTLLVPHADGAAHVRADGTVLRTYPAGAMQDSSPKAALSPNGRFVALTPKRDAIDVHDRKSKKLRRLTLAMDDASSLIVHDDGTVDVGIETPDWDFRRFAPSGKKLHVDGSAASYATSPDRSIMISACDHALTRWDRRGKPASALPIVTGRQGSAVVATKRALYVRTSAGVFQRFSL